MDIVRRGYVPQDAVEFGPKYRDFMERAAVEVGFLINRGYDVKSASTFVGNHYMLSERQRMALARILSPEDMIEKRRRAEIGRFSPPQAVVIDGFNLIVTLEVAFSGSLLIGGADGTVRDLAGLRGNLPHRGQDGAGRFRHVPLYGGKWDQGGENLPGSARLQFRPPCGSDPGARRGGGR